MLLKFDKLSLPLKLLIKVLMRPSKFCDGQWRFGIQHYGLRVYKALAIEKRELRNRHDDSYVI